MQLLKKMIKTVHHVAEWNIKTEWIEEIRQKRKTKQRQNYYQAN